jgi:hypothetical protein
MILEAFLMKQGETFNCGEDVGRIRGELRRISKDLFGKKYRLEILAAAELTGPPIWSRDLARTINLAENVVSTELAACEDLGALQHFPSAHDRRKLYQQLEHPIWAFAAAVCKEVAPADALEAELGIKVNDARDVAATREAPR